MIPAVPILVISFFFLIIIIFNACSLKNSQKFFMQCLPLYTLTLLSMPLNDDIVDMEKLDGICSLTFVVDDFSGFYWHSSSFSSKVQDLQK